jgi:hypothetical protein
VHQKDTALVLDNGFHFFVANSASIPRFAPTGITPWKSAFKFRLLSVATRGTILFYVTIRGAIFFSSWQFAVRLFSSWESAVNISARFATTELNLGP